MIENTNAAINDAVTLLMVENFMMASFTANPWEQGTKSISPSPASLFT
jgi:hypothetical protein